MRNLYVRDPGDRSRGWLESLLPQIIDTFANAVSQPASAAQRSLFDIDESTIRRFAQRNMSHPFRMLVSDGESLSWCWNCARTHTYPIAVKRRTEGDVDDDVGSGFPDNCAECYDATANSTTSNCARHDLIGVYGVSVGRTKVGASSGAFSIWNRSTCSSTSGLKLQLCDVCERVIAGHHSCIIRLVRNMKSNSIDGIIRDLMLWGAYCLVWFAFLEILLEFRRGKYANRVKFNGREIVHNNAEIYSAYPNTHTQKTAVNIHHTNDPFNPKPNKL